MIRKLLTLVEDTRQEGGEDVRPPTRKAAAVAVVDNPFAGRPRPRVGGKTMAEVDRAG
jgi:hypothetical protein